MQSTVASGVGRIVFLLLCLAALPQVSVGEQTPAAPAIRANDNRVSAGTLQDGVLTLHLEITSGDWYPEADSGPSMKMEAFAEEGKAPQIPGPLLRVPQGTEIHVSFHNLLPRAATIHGMHSHPGDAKDVLEVPPGETRELKFLAGEPGTYQYFASAGGELNRGRPFRDDSQLHGAFIVDPAGTVARDRVFVIGVWRSELAPTVSKDVAVINGKSWPYTERLTYNVGDEVHWRWINASDVNHPMHMHGSFYRVDSSGDGERDQIYAPAEQRSVVTQLIPPGGTMMASWSPVAGRWIFHCHLMAHVGPSRTVANALSPAPEVMHEHGANHMAGLVVGITVPGERPKAVAQGRRRKLRLLVRERPPINGVPAGFAYQLEEPHRAMRSDLTLPGPPLILERGRPVEITVENRLAEPTAVHWHGMELESYYDGVVGWGAMGRDLTPAIQPGKSFVACFTPPRSGTFIYHTHLDDEVQLAGGLYGPMIVIEPGARFDSRTDQIFVLSGWGGKRSGDPATPISGLLNGSAQPPTLHWKSGQRYHLRLIDISPQLIGKLTLTGSSGLVQWLAWAKDGADLPASQRVKKDANFMLSPGETYDFEFEAGAPGRLSLEFHALAVPVHITQAIDIE